MEATVSKPRRGRPARAGVPMESFTLHLPADAIVILDEEVARRGFANRASLIRVALWKYFNETEYGHGPGDSPTRVLRAMRNLLRTSVAAGDLGEDGQKALDEMDGLVNLFEDPDAEEKEAAMSP